MDFNWSGVIGFLCSITTSVTTGCWMQLQCRLISPPAAFLGLQQRETPASVIPLEDKPLNASGEDNADPGIYAGVISNTGKVVITELPNAQNFECEFLELFYAQSASPPAPPPGGQCGCQPGSP
jgi:hypothetical protein